MSIFPATHLRKQKHFRATIFGQTDFRGLQSTTSFECDEVIKPGVFGELRPLLPFIDLLKCCGGSPLSGHSLHSQNHCLNEST